MWIVSLLACGLLLALLLDHVNETVGEAEQDHDAIGLADRPARRGNDLPMLSLRRGRPLTPGVSRTPCELVAYWVFMRSATLAAGAVAIPLEPIPGIDLLYDIGVPIVLVWYWFTFLGMLVA